MVHSTTARAVSAAPIQTSGAAVRDLLYKADRPRPVDRYIDFFGDGVLGEVTVDRCGELLLESLASTGGA